MFCSRAWLEGCTLPSPERRAPYASGRRCLTEVNESCDARHAWVGASEPMVYQYCSILPYWLQSFSACGRYPFTCLMQFPEPSLRIQGRICVEIPRGCGSMQACNVNFCSQACCCGGLVVFALCQRCERHPLHSVKRSVKPDDYHW